MSAHPALAWVEPAAFDAEMRAILAGSAARRWFFQLTGRPRAWYDAPRDAVRLRRGTPLEPRLLAHEWGHAVGLEHPPWLSLAMAVDVMGLGLRWTDRHGVLGRSAAWRATLAAP